LFERTNGGTNLTTVGREFVASATRILDGVILVSPAVWDRTFMGLVERSALSIATFAIPNLWLEAPRGLDIHPSNNIAMLRAMARDSLVQKGARADTTAGLMDLMDDALGAAGRLRLPTLVLYGAHEEVLPQAAVKGLLARLPTAGVTAAEYPNGYHMLLRDLDGDIVSRDILSWIEDRKAPLPSGDACRGLTAATASCGHSGN
jgi:alpha-beta hydrolase superfamily lysophospholipase